MFQVRFQFTNLSKGGQPISKYFSKVRLLADTLAATLGNPFPDKEFVTYLLNGLGPSYESFVTSITTRVEPITSQELYHLLLIHESRMSLVNRTIGLPTSFGHSANVSIGHHKPVIEADLSIEGTSLVVDGVAHTEGVSLTNMSHPNPSLQISPPPHLSQIQLGILTPPQLTTSQMTYPS